METKQIELLKKINSADSELHLTEDMYLPTWRLSESLDVNDSVAITQFGTEVQKRLAEISGMMLSSLKNSFAEQVGIKLNELIPELNISSIGIDPDRSQLEHTLRKVEDVSVSLEKYQTELAKELAVIDRMLDISSQYMRELNEYIAATAIILAGISGVPSYALARKILTNRYSELKLTRLVSSRQTPLITRIMNDSSTIAEKVQSTLYNTIPLWRDQIVLALGTDHSHQTIKATRRIAADTNAALLNGIGEILGLQTEDNKLLEEADSLQ